MNKLNRPIKLELTEKEQAAAKKKDLEKLFDEQNTDKPDDAKMRRRE